MVKITSIVLIMICTVLSYGETLLIGDFEKGTDDFTGLAVEKTTGKDSSLSGKLENTNQKWVIASRNLSLDRELKAVEFWIKSSDIGKIAVRIVDSTGQCFQPRVPFKADGKWQKIEINKFAEGEVFGGAADKKIHHPVKKMEFILEGKGTVWIDDIELKLSGKLLPEAAERQELLKKAKTTVISNFENGPDGFSEGIAVVKGQGRAGGAAAEITNKEKKWVESAKALSPQIKNDFLEVSFWVKSSDVNRVAVRFKDSTDQSFQQRFNFEPDGQWHQIIIKEFGKGECWGGAKDKKWHPAAKEIRFILESKGSLLIDDFEAKMDPRKIIQILQILPGKPSNVFIAGEKISLPIETQGDILECVATDYWDKEVFRETIKVINNSAVISPPSRMGYFFLCVNSQKQDGTLVGKSYISYAVIAKHEIENSLNNPFGVMTHFSQGMPMEIMPILSMAGVTTIRDEIYWGSVEKEKGIYQFPENSEAFMNACATYGINPLVEMTFANKLYDNGNTPCSPEGYKGYADYGIAILEKFGSQVKWLEIWNEYNGSFCKGPAKEDRPKYYTEMLKVSYETIKKIRPDVMVLGSAVVLIPLPFFKQIFKNGALNYMDGIVIHPYRSKPEGVEKEVAALRQLIRENNNGKDKPIWATEAGKMDLGEFEWEKGSKMYEKGRRNVANYLVKQYALLLSQNVEKIYWYLAADHGSFTSMGLLRSSKDQMGSLAVAPPYVAYANLANQLHDAKSIGREPFGKYTRAYVIRFKNTQNEDILICWANYPSKIEITSSNPIISVDLMGEEKSFQPDSGKIVFELNKDPIFLKGKFRELREIEAAEKIIASSLDEYSKVQGENNWFYGYFEISADPDVKKAYDFKEMNIVETMWGEHWAGPYKFLNIGGGGAHPEIGDGKQIWPVRRWKSGYDGKVQISGRCNREEAKGDGVTFIILQDGKEIFSQEIGGRGPMSADINLVADIRKGSVIDFCVSPNSNTEYDSTNSDIMIKTLNK